MTSPRYQPVASLAPGKNRSDAARHSLKRHPVTAARISPRQRLWSLQARYAPYLFVFPFVVLFCLFMLYPMGLSAWMSLRNYAGPTLSRFSGLGNYTFLLTDRLFWIACLNTFGYAVAFLALQLPLSLGLACLLNSRRVRYRSVLRFAFFSSYMVGQVFLAVLAHVLLEPRHGFVNVIIGRVIPSIGTEVNWAGGPVLSRVAIVGAMLWVSLGFAMVYWLAALQAVDRELYEASEVDGAGRWMRFRHVTLPGIRPVAIFLLLVGTIAALSLFDLPFVFFQGPGPGLAGVTMVVYLYEQGFEIGDVGFAAAVGWVMVLIILVITLAQIRMTRATRDGA